MISFLDALDLVGFPVIPDTRSMDHKKILGMTDILAVDRVEVTLAESQVMDRIQEVGLPDTIITYKAIDLVGEQVFCLRIILKVCE